MSKKSTPTKLVAKKVSIGMPPSASGTKQTTAAKAKVTAAQMPQPSLAGTVKTIHDKFAELKELRLQIAAAKDLYHKHDELMKELMPLFIEESGDSFIVKREIQIGSKKYRFTPCFWDTKDGTVKAREWKSCAFPVGTIE